MLYLIPLLATLSTPMLDLVQRGAVDQAGDSTFFRSLQSLARSNGWAHPEEYRGDDPIVRGRAVAIGDHVVVLRHWQGLSVPGTEAADLLLIDAQGKLVDTIVCSINSRYGAVAYRAESDGEFSIVFTPPYGNEVPSVRFSHHGQSHEFDDSPPRAVIYRSPVTKPKELEPPSKVQVEYAVPRPRGEKTLVRAGVNDVGFVIRGGLLAGDALVPHAAAVARKLLAASGASLLDAGVLVRFALRVDGSVENVSVSDDPDVIVMRPVFPGYRAQARAELRAQRDALREMVKRAAPFAPLPSPSPKSIGVTVRFTPDRPGKE